MPQISIVVPHQGDTQSFERTLASVLQNLPRDAEVIAPHRGYDDPYGLSEEVDFVEVAAKSAGRTTIGNWLTTAIEHSSADVIHLLTNGVEVTDGWCDWAVAHFQDPYVGAVAPIIVDCDDHEEIIGAGLKTDFCMRPKSIGRGVKNPKKLRHLDPLGPTSTAAFYRKSALTQIEGLQRLGDSTIDLQVALAMMELGFESKLEIDCRISWDEECALPSSAFGLGRYMQQAIANFAAIDGALKSALVTSAAIGAELITAPIYPSNLLRIGGRLMGMLDGQRSRRFRQALDSAAGPHSDRVLSIDAARENRSQDQQQSRRAA